MDNANYENIMMALENLEKHIINLNIRFNGNGAKTMDDLIHALDKPLRVDDRTLINNIERSLIPFKELIKKLDNLNKTPDINEIVFIARRLDAIEKDISSIKSEGIKKNIKLEFQVDGYEMVKKPLGYQKDDLIEEPSDNIKKLLDTLEKREAAVLVARYGLLGETKKTLKATGELFHVHSERIRQIQNRAIRRLRHPTRRNLVNNINHEKLKKDILGE